MAKLCTIGLDCGNTCIAQTNHCQQQLDEKPAKVASGYAKLVQSLPEIAKHEDEPSLVKTLGEGEFAIVSLTSEGHAYKAFKDDSDIRINLDLLSNKPNSRADEVHMATVLGELGVGPKVLSVSQYKKEIYGYEMQCLNGKTLEQSGAKDLESFLQTKAGTDVLVQIAKLHVNGISHNDLHYGNVMTDDEGKTRILDAGLAKQGDKRLVIQDAANLFYSGSKNNHEPGTLGYSLYSTMQRQYKTTFDLEVRSNQTQKQSELAYSKAYTAYIKELKAIIKHG